MKDIVAIQDTKKIVFDAVGVGIGPNNLSLASLLQPLAGQQTRFFERQDEFRWHPGLLFPEATIKVSFLKDLVTLADPSNPYSFLSFLFAKRRLYRFINTNYSRVRRQEFNQYFRWVCASLPNLEFGRTVETITYDRNVFIVNVGNESVQTKNVILGTGLSPKIPDCARPHLGSTVFHGSEFLCRDLSMEGRRVAVVGGGMTGAEIFYHLLSKRSNLPRNVNWITRRPNFLPLDESTFTNEFFTPPYSEYFFGLRPEVKSRILAEQRLASDGIIDDLLEKIYCRLYELDFFEGCGRTYCLYPRRELLKLSNYGKSWLLTLRDGLNMQTEELRADMVVLCTGFEYRIPSCLEPLMDRISLDRAGFSVRCDFSIEWDGPESLKIYVQNAARHSRGVADPNLSLMAWRSAIIVNSLMNKCVYDIREASSVFNWINTGNHREKGEPLI